MGGAVLLIIALNHVSYWSGYYKRVYYKLLGEEIPESEFPDYYAVRGWANTINKLHLEADICFFGNSLTYGGDFSVAFPDKTIVNLGYPGDRLKTMLSRVDMIKSVSPQKVFLMAGINGLKNQDINDFKKQYNALVDSIHRVVPNAELYCESILPINSEMRKGVASNNLIEEANQVILQITESKGDHFINLFPLFFDGIELNPIYTIDGIHLNQQGYDVWYKAIRPFI